MPAELVINEQGAVEIDAFYDPFPKQLELHQSAATGLLAIGGNGSGKSAFLLGEAIYTMTEFPGADCLLMRRNFPELEAGLILDWKNMVPPELYKYNDSKHIVTWLPGEHDSHLFFGHLKDGSERYLAKYLSSSFVFIGFDELGQFSYQAWSFLSSRNRVNRNCKPSTIDGKMPIPRMGAATNPLGPGYGWIKTQWIEHKPVAEMEETTKGDDGNFYQIVGGKRVCVFEPKQYFFVHSTVLDNPAQLEKDPHYIEKLERLPPPLRKKALEGDLESIAGTYFSCFTFEHNVRRLPEDRDEVIFEKWQPRWMSIDWGLAHWTLTYWHTRAKIADRFSMLDENEQLRPQSEWKWKSVVLTYREMPIRETDHTEVCDAISERTPEDEHELIKYCFLSPERFARQSNKRTTHTIAAEMSDRLERHGLPRCSRANDRRVDGAVFMYNLLDAGVWVILDNCPLLIKALETRVRDEKNLEDVLKVDGDQLDDAYDGARYGLLSMLKERGKPEEVKLAEKLSTIPDHTARMLYAYQHRLDQEKRDQPIKQKILPRWMLNRKR